MEYTYAASENGTHELSVGVCDVCGLVYDPEEGHDHENDFNEIVLHFPFVYALSEGERREIETELHQIVIKHRLSTSYATSVFRRNE